MESRTPTTIYETDEDEFMESEDTIPAVEASTTALRQVLEPEKTKKTAKRSLSAPRAFQGGYNLSYPTCGGLGWLWRGGGKPRS